MRQEVYKLSRGSRRDKAAGPRPDPGAAAPGASVGLSCMPLVECLPVPPFLEKGGLGPTVSTSLLFLLKGPAQPALKSHGCIRTYLEFTEETPALVQRGHFFFN